MPIRSEIPLRIVGIDPGTENLGFSVLDLSLATASVKVSYSETVNAQRFLNDYRIEMSTHGNRTARLMALEDRVFIMLEQFQPNAICVEAPFMRKFPMAFAALTECVSYIRRAVMRFDRHMTLDEVDPPTAKMAVGMTIRRGSTKNDVAEAVSKLPLTFAEGIVLAELDEHQIDSIAVAYYRLKQFRDQIPDNSSR